MHNCHVEVHDLATSGTSSMPRAGTVTDPAHVAMLSHVVEQIGEGVCVFDRNDVVVYVNPAFADLHGRRPEELLGTHAREFMSSEDEYETLLANRAVRDIDGGETFRGEREYRLIDGRMIIAHVTVSALRDEAGGALGRIVCVLDVTERRRLEEQLERAAYFDPLTDLANRRLLLERLEGALVAAESADTSMALLYIDLDDFKPVNDAHGHEAGDRLLTLVAERLTACVAPKDTVSRLGGDEFVVLLERVENIDEARGIAERIVQIISEPFELESGAVMVSASVGIGLGPSRNYRSLLHAADSAMFEAKRRGRGMVVSSHL